MAGKTPGSPRKNSSKKSATKKMEPVTPISQGDAVEKPVTTFSEVEINSVEKTVTPINQGITKRYAAAPISYTRSVEGSTGFTTTTGRERKQKCYPGLKERRAHRRPHETSSAAGR